MAISIIISLIISVILNIGFLNQANSSEMMPVNHLEPAENGLPRNLNLPVKKLAAGNLEISATSSAVIDCESDAVLFGKQKDQIWPIASITKLAAALVFLEHNPGWDAIYQIKAEDKQEGGRIYLFTGEKVKVKDLFYFSLVGSDNTAAMALVRSTGLSDEEFINKMNEKARALGLNNTHFDDPVGLNSGNVSTAKEIAALARAAFADKDISEASLTKAYEFETLEGRKKKINNTDALLDIFPQNGIKILGGKTGYIEASGYCFVGKFADHSGNEIISVVLGAYSYNARFVQIKEMVEWVYENYQW
ncbi:serine hydrolase [Patescibacteria group bacterium]|nr:serine hydrolase [Patescibacteria group bacterium]